MRRWWTRRRAIAAGIAVVALCVTVAIAGAWYRHHWIDRTGALDIHDQATLPDHIHVCGRDWRRSADLEPRELSFWRARWGLEPIVVDIAPFAPCAPGPCTNIAAGPCHTVVLVRITEVGYVPFELVGGP